MAASRFVTLLAGIAVLTAAVSLPFGLLLGARMNRSLAVGFYLVGCALLLGGFFTGNRGPSRVANEEGWSASGGRVASGSSRVKSRRTLNMSGLLVLTGLVLLAVGAAVDSNAELV